MPNAVVKSFAKKAGKSVNDVEKLWDETKADTKKKFKKKDKHYWAYVNAVTQRKLGISESHTLSSFLFENDESNYDADSDK
jgi:hypothetical protein